MTKLQKLIGIAAAFTLMVGLSACSLEEASVENNGGQGNFDEFVYHHSNGFSANCVKQDRGLTCDWAHKWPTTK